MYRIMTKTSPSDRSIYKLIRYDDDSLERSSEEVAPLKSDYFVWIDKWGVDIEQGEKESGPRQVI